MIGDQNVNDDYKLPYLSGPMLCELSTTFGLQRTYSRGSGACNLSRPHHFETIKNIVEKWMNFFVLKKRVRCTQITKKVK